VKEILLITGGSGLLALNWALGKRERFSIVLGVHTRKVVVRGVDVQYINLESIETLISSIENIQPQLIVHTAGLTDVELCEADPELAYYVNFELARNVAVACASLSVPLVHISTDHLFSGEHSWISEKTHVSPINVYGRTKAKAEKGVLDACPDALIVRTNFYGWGPMYRRSFSDMIIDALRSGKELTLFKDVYYTPILAEVLVDVTHELVNKKANGVFHVVGDERVSKHEFGLKVAEMFQLNSSLIKSGSISDKTNLTPRPNDMSMSNKKVSQLIGRRIGGLEKHLKILFQQYNIKLAQEIQNI